MGDADARAAPGPAFCADFREREVRFAREAAYGLAERMPHLSARTVITAPQKLVLGALLLAAGAAACFRPDIAFVAIVLLSSASFLFGMAFRGILALLGGTPPEIVEAPVGDAALPIYTILVPLYREANVLPRLARSLLTLDYPHDKLDVKIIVEADDAETIAVARELHGRGPFDIVVVPPGHPKTKPRACNFALNFAHGEFTVIYDAEDRPERDQLRKAVAAFRARDESVACLQARLNFYNTADGWIPKLFAIDYLVWFWSLLPGLDRLGVPMPLGGTSNHFRTDVLRALGGWDPFNVTEDADLGVRIAQLGRRVAMLDSTTFEEAPVALPAWLKQRSRWLKGYMQTWLVHTRDPLALIRNVGWKGFFAFHLFIGGSVLSALLNPLLWSVFLLSVVFHWQLFDGWVGNTVLFFSGGGLICGHAILTGLAVIGPMKRGWSNLTPYGFTVTLYWGLISLAAYRGLHQLVVNPHFWDKTEHGVARPQ
ncbi:MAG: glycosyltransferase [Alphaproteobacteria bacterium]|nr:glycosyltransferase [Alphaproteobacteria bacterium]